MPGSTTDLRRALNTVERTDTERLDFLLKLAGPTVAEQFEFKRNDPVTNANHYVWHKDKEPHCITLSRSSFGLWRIEQCNGKDFEDFEMIELAEGRNLREVIDAAMVSLIDRAP